MKMCFPTPSLPLAFCFQLGLDKFQSFSFSFRLQFHYFPFGVGMSFGRCLWCKILKCLKDYTINANESTFQSIILRILLSIVLFPRVWPLPKSNTTESVNEVRLSNSELRFIEATKIQSKPIKKDS